MSEQHPFQPGQEVAVVSKGRFGPDASYRFTKVAKVYKNGNFVLEGSPQQYRASRSFYEEKSEWSGSSTGEVWDYVSVRLITDKLREEVAASARARRFARVVDDLGGNRGFARRATDTHIADLERILSELNGE
jgi:hypothetical protein